MEGTPPRTSTTGVAGSAEAAGAGSPSVGPGRPSQGHIETRIHWQSSKYEGLVRVEPGRGGGSSFLTFRTITPRSRGWFIPALHGHGLARKAAYAISHGNGARRLHHLVTQAILRAWGEAE